MTRSYHHTTFGIFGAALPTDLDGYVHLTADDWLAAPMAISADDRADTQYRAAWAAGMAAKANLELSVAQRHINAWRNDSE